MTETPKPPPSCEPRQIPIRIVKRRAIEALVARLNASSDKQ